MRRFSEYSEKIVDKSARLWQYGAVQSQKGKEGKSNRMIPHRESGKLETDREEAVNMVLEPECR